VTATQFRTDLTFNEGVHPVSKAAWETIRRKFMHLVYNEEVDPTDEMQFGTALENCFNTLGEILRKPICICAMANTPTW
jgi:hypothetical protein